MDHKISFAAVLEAERGRRKQGWGPVREWRTHLSDADRTAFDAAVDDRRRVTTSDLLRAVTAMSGQGIDYGRLYRYREAVRRGAER
jgi:hypothetical protein